MKKFKFGLGIVAALALAACGVETSEPAENGQEETTLEGPAEEATVDSSRFLTIANGAFPVTMDPTATNEANSSLINTQIYETLVTRDADMNIIPSLATSWERIDDYTVEFNLREGVYFHNGSPFTAHDVEFSLQRSIATPAAAAIQGFLDPEGFEVIDDHTIRISSLEPFAPMLAFLGHNTAFIVSQEAVEEHGDDFANNPVGTGPFQLESFVHGDSITLVRNENFHGDLPQIAGIILRVIPEPVNRLIGLETGEVDLAFDIAPIDAARAEEDDRITLLTRVNNTVRYLSMNTEQAPFDNVLVRQAVNYAIDTQLLIDSILEGFGEPAFGPMARNLPFASTDVEPYGFDLDRARELMAEAGLEDGFDATINIGSAINEHLATVIANMLGEININVDIERLEQATLLEVTGNGDFDMFILGFNPGTGDPDNMLTPMFHSSNIGGAGNRGRFNSPEVDALIEAGRSEFDDVARGEIYHEAQQLIRDLAPWAFLDAGVTLHASRAEVRGYTIRLNGQQTLAGVYFAE
ncbi:MAG: ABC transporter substrate-binding protein [Turicibacter sp.]|nr:ABC transporter substrate-binding protein [Turicibacter sp.]